MEDFVEKIYFSHNDLMDSQTKTYIYIIYNIYNIYIYIYIYKYIYIYIYIYIYKNWSQYAKFILKNYHNKF